MKKKIEAFVDLLVLNEKCNLENRDIVVFGISSAISTSINVMTMIMLGMIFDLLVESIAFLIAFPKIRTYAGGYHCKKSRDCYIVSSMTIVLVLLVIKFTNIQYFVPLSVGLLLVSIPVLLTLAPIGTETKILDNEETEYFRKKTRLNLLIECIIVGALFVIGLPNIALIMCLGIFVSEVLVLIEVIVQKIKN